MGMVKIELAILEAMTLDERRNPGAYSSASVINRVRARLANV